MAKTLSKSQKVKQKQSKSESSKTKTQVSDDAKTAKSQSFKKLANAKSDKSEKKSITSTKKSLAKKTNNSDKNSSVKKIKKEQSPRNLSPKNFWRKLKRAFYKKRTQWREFRGERANPHHSFRRSYREDYRRKTETPGLLSHAVTTFQIVFKHWRTFLPFVLIMTAMYVILVGLLNEETYQQFQESIDETSHEIAGGEIGNFAKAGLLLISSVTTGGLETSLDETQMTFMIFLFLVMWLVTIYLMRHFIAGGKPKLRDGLYNALSPLISTMLVFGVIFIQCVPIMLVIVTYSAAILTNFLATPFYALVYFIFAALMILISAYLLSSSLLALVAVTAPGMYPLRALFTASDLMAGRRTKFLIRLIYLIIVVIFIYIVIITPIILIDLILKSAWDWLSGVPIVPFCLLMTTCFVFIYATTYLYRYYRWLLDYREK